MTRGRTLRSVLIAGAAVSLSLVSPVLAGQMGFAKIEGVDGSVAEAEHKGWLPLLSFSWEPDPNNKGVRRAGDGTSGYVRYLPETEGPGRLILVKSAADKTPALNARCTGERELGTVVIHEPRETVPFSMYDYRAGRGFSLSTIDPAILPPFLEYKLIGAKVEFCDHQKEAKGEVFRISFQAVEYVNFTRSMLSDLTDPDRARATARLPDHQSSDQQPVDYQSPESQPSEPAPK